MMIMVEMLNQHFLNTVNDMALANHPRPNFLTFLLECFKETVG